MSGIYGDILLAWPEQNRTIEVYDQNPKINAGWDAVTDPQTGKVIKTPIVGVFQNTRGGGIKNSNGNLNITEGCEFWCHTDNLDSKFFEWENKVFRI